MKTISITKQEDIPQKYINTPIEELLLYHNFKMPFKEYNHAKLLIGMCMDYRKELTIPRNFAYIIRSAGANLKHLEFNVSYAIAIGGIKYILLLSHNNCGMVDLMSKKEKFIDGLITNANWSRENAEEHFMNCVSMFEIKNEEQFVLDETEEFKKKYDGITVVPAHYQIEDNMIYLLEK